MDILTDKETGLPRIPAGDYDLVYQGLTDEWHVLPSGSTLRAELDGKHNFLGWFMKGGRDFEWWSNHGQPEVSPADVEGLRQVLRSSPLTTGQKS